MNLRTRKSVESPNQNSAAKDRGDAKPRPSTRCLCVDVFATKELPGCRRWSFHPYYQQRSYIKWITKRNTRSPGKAKWDCIGEVNFGGWPTWWTVVSTAKVLARPTSD